MSKNNKSKIGKSLLDTVINHIPFELHIPTVKRIHLSFYEKLIFLPKKQYQYCGPGTKLKKRLERGDSGINGLDQACKQHDIAYSENQTGEKRREADNILGNLAWERFKSSDASLSEKMNSLAVAGIMKTKSKLVLGLKKGVTKNYLKQQTKRKIQKPNIKNKNRTPTTKQVLSNAIKDAKRILSVGNPASVDEATKLAVSAALASVKKHKLPKKKFNENIPRVIAIPKIGGMLPLVPIFAGLSALGALMGGTASVTNAVIQTKNAKENLTEANRHNKTIEAMHWEKPKLAKEFS